jgi:sigma-B regulation protein RsbU (phosphoserine phosphatase)
MSGTAREIALELVHRDGHTVPVLVNAVADRASDGRVEVVRVAVFDATHRRHYERELLRAKERAEASEGRARALARTLQQTLIPPTPPVIPQLDVAAVYRPAGDGSEVGGDFYDVFQVGGGDWVVIIGDVCGKGAEAAVVTALARYTLRAAAMEHAGPAGALRRLNDVMLQSATDRFCTVAMVRLRQTARTWSGVVSTAGHPPPILRRADGTLTSVGEQGVLVGVVAEPELSDVVVPLKAGEVLLLYTDGLPEARRGDDFYGDDRVREIATAPHRSAAALADALLENVLEFQGGTARDDIAIVVLRAD